MTRGTSLCASHTSTSNNTANVVVNRVVDHIQYSGDPVDVKPAFFPPDDGIEVICMDHDAEALGAMAPVTLPFVDKVAVEPEVPEGSEYTIIVERRELGDTGLRVWQKANVLTVRKVKSGIVRRWNEDHPLRCVRVGDILVEVNGVRGPASTLVARMKLDTSLNVVFQRGFGDK